MAIKVDVPPRRILSLYDLSGVWSAPYEERSGYIVHRVDLAMGGDVRLLEAPSVPVHGILAAPPCTVFASSGARHARTDEQMIEGLGMVDAVMRLVWATKPQWWVIENPIGRLSRYLGPPKLIFDPCEYGDPYTKKTCLWGKFTVPTKTPVPPEQGSAIVQMSGREARRRAVTPEGFARAFAAANP